jgi:hypothetical protein
MAVLRNRRRPRMHPACTEHGPSLKNNSTNSTNGSKIYQWPCLLACGAFFSVFGNYLYTYTIVSNMYLVHCILYHKSDAIIWTTRMKRCIHGIRALNLVPLGWFFIPHQACLRVWELWNQICRSTIASAINTQS